MKSAQHLLAASALSLAIAASAALTTRAQPSTPLRFAISFPTARSAQPLDGRVLLFISDDGKTEPKSQSDQYRANTTRPIFGVDVDGLKPGQPVFIDDTVVGWPARSLKDIKAGDYYVQALINRYETFHRADGHTVKMPMDQGEGQHWDTKPGNFYSKPVKMRVDPAGGEIKISMDQEIPPIAPNQDTAQVKYIRVQNERLTKFWGRPMHLGAIITLPQGWDTHPAARYPILIHHGHFPKNAASDTWRETPPEAGARGTERDTQEAAYQFYKDWNGPDFPRMIHVLVQHPTPYFDDSYAVNSANHAVYQTEDFFKTTKNPPADAEIVYGERREHCFTGDTQHPNNVGSRTVHQRYMPAMARWMIKTAPSGADIRSWVY